MNLKSKLLGTNPNESTPLSRAIFFVIIGIAFYLLDRFSLFYLDDYMYAYKFGTYEPIKTLKDILESQCDHYMQHNGRFLVHCIVQMFCGILGVEWFRIFNTIAFCAFAGLTTRIIYNSWNKPIVYYAFASLIILLFIPRISFTILGNMSMCINYLWVGVATLCFFLLLDKLKYKKTNVWYKNVGYVLVGILIGSLQESFSIPVAGALFIYYCINFKKFRGSIVWLVCGYWLGSLILVLAPSNFLRLDQQSHFVGLKGLIFDSIYRMMSILFDYKLFIVFGAIVLIGLLLNRKKYIEFICCNQFYFLMLMIAISFPILVAYTKSHQLFFAGWLVIILMLRLIKIHFKPFLLFPLAILFTPMYVYTYKAMANISEKRMKRIENVINSDAGCVISEYNANDITMWPSLIYRFVDIPINDIFLDYVSMYHTGRDDNYKVLLPCLVDELAKICNDNNELSDNVYYLPNYQCYVAKVPSGSEVKLEVEKINPILSYDGIINLIKFGTLNSKAINPDYELRNVVTIGDFDCICYYVNYVKSNGKIVNITLI